jgi:hypothetical protein
MSYSNRRRDKVNYTDDTVRNDNGKPVQLETGEPRNYMYVPPFDSLLKAIGVSRQDFEQTTHVTIPTELLRLLLQIAIANSDFNSKGYLSANPDVAESVQSGVTKDPHVHYVGFGFFEGRAGATPEVDEAWYLRTYPDVADGLKSGQVKSAAEHFRVAGVIEGRSPSLGYSLAAEQWKRVFGRS